MAKVKINGKEITVAEHTLILNAARDAGFEIPTFCYQADLMSLGSCRMCLVEIEGQRKLQPSCVTPVLDGMEIYTDSPTVVTARAGVLEFLLSNHALDCPVCDKGGECELQDMVYKYGPNKGRYAEKKYTFHDKDYLLSPVIVKNSNRCVRCQKCVRVCSEVVGRGVLGSLDRGQKQEEMSFARGTLDCDHCGNCIEVCPVGCFMRRQYRYKTRPWDLTGADTICPYCATGCRMVIEERDGVVLRSRAQLGVGLNSETLCARGRFGFDFINGEERIKTPLVRKHGKLEPASWQDALRVVREKMLSAAPERVGGIASPRLTNEELYLFQKLMRKVIKTPNVDSSSRWGAAAVEGFVAATNMSGGGVSVFDCMESDSVLVIGSHISDENPIVDYIVRRISANRSMNLVVASPRAMKLDSSATISLRHNPAAEKEVLDAVTRNILDSNAEKLIEGEAVKHVREAGIADLFHTAGLREDELRLVSQRLNSSETISILVGTGFLRHPEGLTGLVLLKDVLSSLGKKVTLLPLFDRCNQRGAWEMGVHPELGPGYNSVEHPGLGTEGMLEAAEDGGLDLLYVAGEDLAAMYPDAEFAVEALSRIKFLVVQDMFLTETAKMADVVLPSASFAEKEGTFTNQEGRVQSLKRLMPPVGKARADIDIIRAVGKILDPVFGPSSPALVLEEIRNEVDIYSEVNLEFNNKKNIDNRLDNKGALVKGSTGPALEASRVFAPKADAAMDERYSFRLVTGNHLFHSGRFSRRSPTLRSLLDGAVVEISEQDAASLGLTSGESVRVVGEHHEAELTLKTKKGTKKGVAFIAENYEDVAVNRFYKRGVQIPRVSIERA